MASPNGRVDGKTNGTSAIRFLWIEDWYGNAWQFRDGDNIQKFQHYYCNDRSAYADKVYNGSYFKVGYMAGQKEGYVKTFGYDKEWPEIEICTETGAGTTSYFCDYYWMARVRGRFTGTVAMALVLRPGPSPVALKAENDTILRGIGGFLPRYNSRQRKLYHYMPGA